MKRKTLSKRLISNRTTQLDVDVAAPVETFQRHGVFAIRNLPIGSWCKFEQDIMPISCRLSNAGNICLRKQERSCVDCKQNGVAVQMSSTILIEEGCSYEV